MERFQVISIFDLTNRGTVIVGNLLTEGSISKGDSMSLSPDMDSLIIQSIEMIDDLSDKSHIGLIVSQVDASKLKEYDIIGKELQILSTTK